MDPITAALVLANTIAEIIKLAIEATPIEIRAQFAREQLEGLKQLRALLERLVTMGGAPHA